MRVPITDFMELRGQASVLKSSMSSTDYNNDGVVTDIDILLAVYDKVYAQPIIDLDNDGVITAADGLLSIRQVVISTMSDPDGDGQVSLNDALLVAAELNKQFPDLKLADTNGDGQLTLDDFTKVLDDMNAQLHDGDMPMDLAQAVFARMGWAVEVGIENLRQMVAAPHNVIVSFDWHTHPGIPPADAHNQATSQAQWPANHYYSSSVEWRKGEPNSLPPVPGHVGSTSTEWPANHSWGYSRSWTRPEGTPYAPHHHWSWVSDTIPTHTRDISQDLVPATHHINLSMTWPPEHQGSFTRLWPNAHTRDTSMQWPANHIVAASHATGNPRLPDHTTGLSQLAPTTHQTAISTLWPNAHLGNISRSWIEHTSTVSQGYPPNHLYEHSAHWGWDVHAVHQSAKWPPNHVVHISRTWLSHLVANSISWPATHGRALSMNWPPGYRGWPANHDLDVTKNWHAPQQVPLPFWNPPTQFFPAGHSWMTTLQEFIPMIPIPRPPAN
ncbi:MAG: hypothetical protein Q8L55_14875 [Phycisphaerales bacterium]|nr:hypothetical protein [Phycisphaerales bacterium]